MSERTLELKYCERCGSLGLRRKGCGEVYCESCAREMRKVYRVATDGRKVKDGAAKKPCVSVGVLEACTEMWGGR
jgi:hypothetical protein